MALLMQLGGVIMRVAQHIAHLARQLLQQQGGLFIVSSIGHRQRKASLKERSYCRKLFSLVLSLPCP
jgi:16S rRNA G1207 methylase RsmC